MSDCDLTFTVAGQTRRAVLRPASATPQGLPPLVIFFHGFNKTPPAAGAHYDLWTPAGAIAKPYIDFKSVLPDAIVVYAEGSRVDPNQANPCPPLPQACGGDPLCTTSNSCRGWTPRYPHRAVTVTPQQTADLAYLDELLDQVSSVIEFNERNVFAVGFSNGAFFDTSLHLLRPGTFRGIAAAGMRQRFAVTNPTATNGVNTVDFAAVAAAGAADPSASVLFMIGAADGFADERVSTLQQFLVRTGLGQINTPDPGTSLWATPASAWNQREFEHVATPTLGHCWPGPTRFCIPGGPDYLQITADFVQRNIVPYFRIGFQPVIVAGTSQKICLYQGPASDAVDYAQFRVAGGTWSSTVQAGPDGTIDVGALGVDGDGTLRCVSNEGVIVEGEVRALSAGILGGVL